MVKANASAVKKRINKLITSLPSVANAAGQLTAEATVKRVKSNAGIALGTRKEQVGFDLGQFMLNIEGTFKLGDASYGILDTEAMGTEADYDAIAGLADLWHRGTGAGESFRRLIFTNIDRRAQVEANRRSIWGKRTPQWFFLENGTSDPGAMGAPIPPTNFIRKAKDPAIVFAEWRVNIIKQLRSRGVL